MQLRATGEGSLITGPSLWGATFSPVSVWEEIYSSHRPQTLNFHFESKEGHTLISSSTVATLGHAYQYDIEFKTTAMLMDSPDYLFPRWDLLTLRLWMSLM